MTPTPALEQLLGRVFDEMRKDCRATLDRTEYDRRRGDFVFHMSDWLADAEALVELARHPERQDVDKATTFLVGFLYHVLPHLKAAGRLLLDDIPDPFSVPARDLLHRGVPSMSAHDRRAQLRDLYGFDFPDDLFRFWEFAKRLRPLEPLRALEDACGAVLCGPFDVLAGHFDGRTPHHSPLLHWRYWMDPPEFFTVLVGDTDGLHWGYWLDDPDAGPDGCVAHYWAHDSFEVAADGDTLFEAVRADLEHRQRDNEDALHYDPDHAAAYRDRLREIDRVRRLLMRCATGRRTAAGLAYTDRWDYRKKRRKRATAPTQEGMGLVVPADRYRPLSLPDGALRKRLWKDEDPADLVAEARRALAEGFPGTALKLGKELWAVGGSDRRAAYAAELLDDAYLVLGRRSLRRVLAEHLRHRDRLSLDVLHAEDANGDGAT